MPGAHRGCPLRRDMRLDRFQLAGEASASSLCWVAHCWGYRAANLIRRKRDEKMGKVRERAKEKREEKGEKMGEREGKGEERV